MASNKSMLSSDEITNILKEKQKNIKYDTKDWSIELVLSKFHKQTEKIKLKLIYHLSKRICLDVRSNI